MTSASHGLFTKTDEATLRHLLKYGDNTSFTDHFWKNCEPHPKEVARFPLYVKVLILSWKGKSLREVVQATGVKPQSVTAWTTFRQKPKLGHYLAAYLGLGPPREGWTWLSMNNA